MAVELYTYTGQRVADEVTQKFGDIGMVQISTAMLLTWNNMDHHGDPNDKALHESLPITAGIKNVVTKWFRERPWGWV